MGNKQICVTGGAGYIGTHTVLEMLTAGGFDVTVIDNFHNSSEEGLRRVQELTGKSVTFAKIDLLDAAGLDALFTSTKFDSVIHFAGLKAVGESVAKPLFYYENNIAGTVNLLKAMEKGNCRNIVFSSSATVYGDPASVPVKEDFPISATNPYGRTKLFIEEILRDLYKSNNAWNVILLRYFNPVGAHASGKIGEDPKGIPNNLMPFIQQVAVGRREFLSVFGSDYPTPDGTGVRDYIHVMDLAEGHLMALDYLAKHGAGHYTFNLGTGKGYSVLDMVKAMEKASGRTIKYKLVERRPGDLATVYADTKKAAVELGWTAKLGLDEMCRDLWAWQSANPQGFAKK